MKIRWVAVVLIGCGAVNILTLGFPVCSIGTATPTGKSLYASRVRFMALYQTGLKTFTTLVDTGAVSPATSKGEHC